MKLTPYQPHAQARRILLTVFFLSVAVRLVFLGLDLLAGLTPLGTVTLPLLNFVVLISALLLIRKRRALLYSLCGLLLAGNLAWFFICNDGAEYVLPSPEQSSALVIRERSALVSSGWADVYKREYGILKRKLPVNIGTDDNYQPFAQGQYRIDWAGDTLVYLEYYNGHGYQQIEIDLG